jgi:ATP phosphoribosyltransferase
VSTLVETRPSNAVILLPKNRGLLEQTALAVASLPERLGTVARVRGEDVGALSNEAARHDRTVFALTGDDLLDEWLAAGNALDPRLARRRIPWSDPDALFGAPALCAIVPSTESLQRTQLRVAICARYARLADPYLTALESRGVSIARSYMQGALETVVAAGLADAAVDIVVTGRSIRAAGLRVAAMISKSDVAVLETV